MAMSAKVERINPAVAKEFLKNSVNIRKPNREKIRQMVRDMKHGTWEENGETLKWHENGSFVDGQNRIMAVIESKTTQSMAVVRGIKADQYVDIGEKRTLAQILRHEGVSYAQEHASAVANLLHLKANIAGISHPRFSQTDRIECYATYKKRLSKIIPDTHNTKNLYWRSGITSVLTLGTNPRDYAACKHDFLEYLSDGAGMEKDDPVYLLREVQLAAKRNRMRYVTHHRLALIALAWNYHREGIAVNKLKFNTAGPNPDSFPKVL